MSSDRNATSDRAADEAALERGIADEEGRNPALKRALCGAGPGCPLPKGHSGNHKWPSRATRDRQGAILATIHDLSDYLLADPSRLGHSMHDAELHHVEVNGGITVAIRPVGAARNGMVFQYIGLKSARQLLAKLEAAIAKADGAYD